MLMHAAVRTWVAAARRSVVPALLGAPTLRRAPSAFHVWPLHVTRRGGSPLHVKIGLAALSAAGAGFAAVKAVALSMPEAGDAEVTMELQKHARRMGIDELVIAKTTDDDDSQASQAALTALILDTEQALRLNRGPDGELVHRDTTKCECDMCKRTLSEAEARIAWNIVNERWTDKSSVNDRPRTRRQSS